MKKILTTILGLVAPMMMLAAGWPANYGGVMMQGFYWDSFSNSRWTVMTSKADTYSQYFDLIWVPNSCRSTSNASMGYDPVYWFTHSSGFGNETALREMISTYKAKGTGIISDVVLNHKSGLKSWCDFPEEKWGDNIISWSLADICKNDEAAAAGYKVTGANDTGDNFDGSRDLDHTSANVQKNVKLYLNFLLNDLGYAGFRLDMVKGYGAQYTKLYNQSAKPTYCVGEYWDGSHSAVTNWIKNTGYESAAFDFPLKYVINRAFGNGEWSALSDKGIAGDPNNNRYAVTFVDNHDTYRNNDKLGRNELAANAFILALPGTPCVLLPHFQQYQEEIGAMIKARKAAGITNQSSITSQGAQGGGYVMKVQGSVGTVLFIAGYVTDVDTKGFKLVKSGQNYAYFVSDNVKIDSGGTSEPKDIHVYISAPKAPYIYAWNGGGQLTSDWPGIQLTTTATTSNGAKWYTTTFKTTSFNMVINDGGDNKTTDINGITDDIYIQYSGTTNYSDVTRLYKNDSASVALPECATWQDGKLFCYFEGNADYASPNAWIWNDSKDFTGGTWPGTKLKSVGKTSAGATVWLWDGGTLDEKDMPTGAVFSTGTGTPQTTDFVFTLGGYYNTGGLIGQVKKPDAPQPALKGDVNGDGVVDIADVNAVIDIILGMQPNAKAGDVNEDGSIDVADINNIINIILGL